MMSAGSSGSVSDTTNNGDRAAHTVRRVVQQLQELEPATARCLAGLAFILTRVADADESILPEETQSIEAILNEYANLPEEQAVLVTEIARHRQQYADCACTYKVSRELRQQASAEHRRGMLRYLFAVALADGRITPREHGAIVQIASELGFARAEVEAAQTQLTLGRA